MRVIRLIGAALLATVLGASAAQKPVVKIGVLLPLTGDLAQLGVPCRNAILLAQEQAQNKKYRYELVIEDVQYSASKASLAANKLMHVDRVDAILNFADLFGKIINPLVEKRKILHLCFSSDSSVAAGRYNFTMGPQPDDEARMMAACLKKRRLNSVVLISQIDTYTLALKKAQEAVYPKEGIHVVGNLTFGGEERDFRMLVTKAKQLRPDIYLLATFPPCLELLTTRMREAGLANFSGIEIFENTTDFRLYEGMWYVCEGNPAPEFSSAYQKRFGEKPITWAANFYDMFNLLVQAFEKAPGGGKPSAVLAIEELEQIKKFSGAGGVLRQDADGVFRVPVVEKIIKNGQPEQAQP